MAEVACENLTKRFGDVFALSDVSCLAGDGEVLLVLGPSGAGKSTLLSCIAGLVVPEAGTVRINGKTVTAQRVNVPPHRRGLAFVFQRPALWPHLTALDNVALALAGTHLTRKERRRRAREVLGRLGLSTRERAYPATLSGGELQRAGFARALVAEPEVLLLDEPFTALDPSLRAELLDILRGLKSECAITAIWVDQRSEDALSLADGVLLLRAGCVEQSGALDKVFARPATAFAARFLLGANLVEGELVAPGRARTVLGELACDASAGDRPLFAVSPDSFAVSSNGSVSAQVQSARFHLHYTAYEVDIAGARVRLHLKERFHPGEALSLKLTAAPTVVPPSQVDEDVEERT